MTGLGGRIHAEAGGRLAYMAQEADSWVGSFSLGPL